MRLKTCYFIEPQNVSTSKMTMRGAFISKCAKHVQDRRLPSAFPFHARINEHARIHATLGREKPYVKSSFETTKTSNTTNDFSPMSKLSSSIWNPYVFWCCGLWARKMFSIGSTRISGHLCFPIEQYMLVAPSVDWRGHLLRYNEPYFVLLLRVPSDLDQWLLTGREDRYNSWNHVSNTQYQYKLSSCARKSKRSVLDPAISLM